MTKIWFCLFFCLGSWTAFAQNPQETTSSENSDYSSEIGLHAGALLPSRIPGVREIVHVTGLRYSSRLPVGSLEADLFTGRGDGAIYHSLATDYRLNLKGDLVPTAHVLLGAHIDYFRGRNAVEYKPALGWHYGGGLLYPLADAWWVRFDFKYRFSPGTSLYVGLGLVLRMRDGGGANP